MTDVVEFRPKVVEAVVLRRNETLIAALEIVLAEAKAGEVLSAGVAVVRTTARVQTFFDSYDGDSHSLGTAISMLHHRYFRKLLDE